MENNTFQKIEKKVGSEYQYFKREDVREGIYEFSSGLAKYLHDQNIPNVIFLDRSPRPLWVGLDEYWKLNYKKEKPRPNIYFVNPDAFDVVERATSEETEDSLIADKIFFSLTGESRILEKAKKLDQETRDLFTESYFNLRKDKDKTIAVFDNCIHSGKTIEPFFVFLGQRRF